MAGEAILKAEMAQITSQKEVDFTGYDVYVDDYPNYGNFVDCGDYH
jgi:hypothetical protein